MIRLLPYEGVLAIDEDDALIGSRKADFTTVYDEADPRAYFQTLGGLDYQIPQQSLPVLQAVLAASYRDGRPRTVLDVCCSYGINAALLRCDVRLEEITARYADPALEDCSVEELIEADARFYSSRRRSPDVPVLGLDIAESAIDYGCRVGLLTVGWAEDLEVRDPSPILAAGVREVGLIISTGGVGYVGDRTFRRLLEAVESPSELWLAVFVLRAFSYDDIAATLARYGLVTEHVPGVTFRQRRFADRDEYDAAIHDVELRGLDPAGKEAEGWYHAECYLTRPAAAAATPLADVLGGALRQQ
jgi:SAM-dependent methyltransferase